MFGELWDWMVEKMENLTENMKEYKRRWEAEHKEKRRSQNLEAVKRYQEKLRSEDEEGFKAKHNEIAKASAKKRYAEKKAQMTPEELEEQRRKNAEKMRKYREKKRLQAQQLTAAAESKPEE